MLDIDPAEALLAVVGLKPIISKEVERFRVAQAREAADYAKTIYKEAALVVAGERAKVPFSGINYKKMLRELTEEYSEGQLLDMVSKFPEALHAVTSDFVVKAKQVVEFLRSIFPVQTRTTLLEQTTILPSALAIQRFATAFDVLDNPLRVLAHIANGSLLSSQSAVMKQIYPSVSAAITDALDEAGDKEKARSKSFTLRALGIVGQSKWRGQPAIPVSVQQRMQNNFAAAKAEQAKPPAPAGQGVNSTVAKESITNTQRGLFPSQTSQQRG